MKIQDLVIDPRSLGNKFWLVNIVPAYEYRGGTRTDNIVGYRYETCLPERSLEKINVRIDTPHPLLEAPNGFIEVKYEGLEVFIYWSQGQPQVGARATGITVVSPKG